MELEKRLHHHKNLREHTAISGLSANTYSWGGEGSRFGGGDSDSFLKYFAMPTGSSMAMEPVSSSDGGADESDDRSESERDMFDMFVVLSAGGGGEARQSGRIRGRSSTLRYCYLLGLERGFYAPGLSGIIENSPYPGMINTQSR